jgi:hypothetical protein
MTQKCRKLFFSCESDSDTNGQSKNEGVMCEFHPSPCGTGPAGRGMASWFDPRGVANSSLCFWTTSREAAPGIHLAPSKPPVRVQIGQRDPTSARHHRKSGVCSTHFTPRNFFNSGPISMMYLGKFLRKGVLRGFKQTSQHAGRWLLI